MEDSLRNQIARVVAAVCDVELGVGSSGVPGSSYLGGVIADALLAAFDVRLREPEETL